MVTKKIAFVTVLVCATSILFASEFIQKRPKKGPSMGALKEQCCQRFGDSVKQQAPLLSHIAQFQQKAIDAIEGYWQSDNSSWCLTASKEKLIAMNEKLALLEQQQKVLIAQYENLLKEIQ